MFARYDDLSGQSVFITGGASGIGAALVEAFAAQGARVGFADMDEAAGRALEAAHQDSERVAFFRVDLRDIKATQSAIAMAMDRFGPVTILINNAGHDARHSLEDLDTKLWDDLMAINLRPHAFTTKACAPAMRTAGYGSIINLTSNNYLLGLSGYPAYATAKAAVAGLTKVLARELGPAAIRVNAIAPGWVITERQRRLWLTPDAEKDLLEAQALKRLLMPEDIASMALFLASHASRAITGQLFIVDGGRV